MYKPVITKEKVKTIYENRFLKAYDLQYEEGKHYYVASRRTLNELTAIMNDDEIKNMVPDAVSCAVILNIKGREPVLCLSREYRFPAGHFLLSVPAGLIDKEDVENENPAFVAAKRELEEEMGIKLENSDELTFVSPLLFSTPGMTDESNAVVQVVINRDSMKSLIFFLVSIHIAVFIKKIIIGIFVSDTIDRITNQILDCKRSEISIHLCPVAFLIKPLCSFIVGSCFKEHLKNMLTKALSSGIGTK